MTIFSLSKLNLRISRKPTTTRQNTTTEMEHTPISRRETAPPTSNPHGTSLEDEEHIEPTEGLRRDSKLQILNEMYQKIKNGELGIALQESLGLFEGYLVNLNQSYKTNNSMTKLLASEDALHLLSLIS